MVGIQSNPDSRPSFSHQGLSVLLRKVIVRTECDTSCAWSVQDFLPIQHPFPCALLFSYSLSPSGLNGDCLSISDLKDGHLTWAWPIKTIHLLATVNQLRMGTFPNSNQSGQIGPNSSYFILCSLNYQNNRTSVQNRWQPQEVNLPKKEANQKITDEKPWREEYWILMTLFYLLDPTIPEARCTGTICFMSQ